MKRTEVKELMDTLNRYREFNYALLLHEDVFSGEILTTYILSPDSFEIHRWLEQKMAMLKKCDVPYVGYINGTFEDSNNKIIFED